MLPFNLPLRSLGRAFFWAALTVTIASRPGYGHAATPSPTVIISELMAANDSFLKDEEGDYSDWLELRNHGEEPVNLQGLHLTDSRRQPRKWTLPDLLLPAGGRRIVFASGKDRRDPEGQLHASFKLSAKGDYLALVDRDGRTILHEYLPKYPAQKADTSFGIGEAWRAGTATSGHQQFFVRPTPGKPNAGQLLGEVTDLVASKDHGLFERPFQLTLSTETPGTVIRYTTNGSEPTEQQGEIYTAPLSITKTTVLRAAAFKPDHLPTRVLTRTYLFPQDVIHQSPDGLPPEGFPFLWGVNQVDYGMDPRIVNDPRFTDEIVTGLRSLPSVSIVTDMDLMFGEKNGVYSNPGEQGRESERPTSVELIHPDGTTGFQIDCGIRIRGGFSRLPINPKHALRLFFRDEYGPAKLRYPLFGRNGAQEFDNLDLRTFQNYSWSLGGDTRGIFVRDQFNRDLQLAMGQPAARGEFVHLYINGHYWGIYNTCERIEASYGATYLGGKKSDYDVVKVDSGFTTRRSTYTMIPTDGNMEAWSRLFTAISGDLSDNRNYFALQGRNPDGTRNPALENLLEVDNLIEYMLIIFWGGNLDAPVSAFGGNRNPNNYHSLRRRNGEDGFRFFVWDAEHTMLDINEDRTGPFKTGERIETSSPQAFFQRLMDNAEFRLRVADLVHRHFSHGGVLHPESLRERFVARTREIESAVIAESARWGDVKHTYAMNPPPRFDKDGNPVTGPFNREDDWRREVRRIADDYIPKRSGIVLGQLFAQGLIPDLQPPQIQPAGTAGWKLTSTNGPATIYYTTDGSDPRLVGGGVSPRAKRYEGPVQIEGTAGKLKARAVIDGDWSALAEIR
jgi:hypothetical protein